METDEWQKVRKSPEMEHLAKLYADNKSKVKLTPAKLNYETEMEAVIKECRRRRVFTCAGDTPSGVQPHQQRIFEALITNKVLIVMTYATKEHLFQLLPAPSHWISVSKSLRRVQIDLSDVMTLPPMQHSPQSKDEPSVSDLISKVAEQTTPPNDENDDVITATDENDAPVKDEPSALAPISLEDNVEESVTHPTQNGQDERSAIAEVMEEEEGSPLCIEVNDMLVRAVKTNMKFLDTLSSEHQWVEAAAMKAGLLMRSIEEQRDSIQGQHYVKVVIDHKGKTVVLDAQSSQRKKEAYKETYRRIRLSLLSQIQESEVTSYRVTEYDQMAVTPNEHAMVWLIAQVSVMSEFENLVSCWKSQGYEHIPKRYILTTDRTMMTPVTDETNRTISRYSHVITELLTRFPHDQITRLIDQWVRIALPGYVLIATPTGFAAAQV